MRSCTSPSACGRNSARKIWKVRCVSFVRGTGDLGARRLAQRAPYRINPMPPRFKVNALLAFLLALLFYFFFMHTKHDAALSAVNAFAEDPYDAVGSFGIQAALFCGVVCLIRAFRPQDSEGASLERRIFVVRAQMAAVLSVGAVKTVP